MANSLRAKLRKLKHDGYLTDTQCQELVNKLDGHDRELRNKVIDEVVDEIMKQLIELEQKYVFTTPALCNTVLRDLAKQMKDEIR